MTIQKDKDLVSKFKDLENQVPKEQGTLKDTILSIFKEFPTTSFTQGNFSKRLGKRTQHVNHVLTELRKENLIIREGSRKQYYFRLNSK